jgi:hypothetical protein
MSPLARADAALTLWRRPALAPAGIDIVHHVVCRHQVEIEVWPARATVYFQDERWIDPVNTQIRFEAIIYNAQSGVSWQVLAPDGGAGAGSIDATGLYRAPPKAALASGATDLVVATVREDPLRKASAWVTLVGLGPAPAPLPRIEIWPKRRTLYYRSGLDSAFIDDRNKMQIFRAFLSHSPTPQVRWLVNGVAQAGTDSWFLYNAPANGAGAVVTVAAQINALPAVQDDARIVLENYDWPGI